MNARTAPAGAGRYDHLHGDEDQGEPYTAAEEARLDRRVDEIIADKIFYGDLTDLFAGLEPAAYVPELQRALLNLDAAIKIQEGALIAVFSALNQIKRAVSHEANRLWREDARAQAERELIEGGLP